jgi:hypothetical protein
MLDLSTSDYPTDLMADCVYSCPCGLSVRLFGVVLYRYSELPVFHGPCCVCRRHVVLLSSRHPPGAHGWLKGWLCWEFALKPQNVHLVRVPFRP